MRVVLVDIGTGGAIAKIGVLVIGVEYLKRFVKRSLQGGREDDGRQRKR